MGWNGSSAATSAATNKKIAKPRKASSGAPMSGAFKGTLALILVLAIGAGAYWYVTNALPKVKESIEEKVEKKPIEEVEGAVAPAETKTVSEVEEVKPKKPLPPQRVGELRDGYRLLPSGKLHRVLGIVTNTPPKISIAEKTFKHSADVELGHLLMVEPGDDLLGDSEGMYRGFKKELEEALAEPIEYDKDDTEFQRELKDAVIDLRKELVARMKAGEDVEQLMEDTRNQLKELALYREELENQVKRISGEDASMTQEDYDDLVEAANMMLEERGSKPMELPMSLKRTVRLHQIEEQEREKARKARLENEQE